MEVFIFLAVWLFFGIICSAIGSGKGEGCLGFIVGVIFGPFGLLFVLFSSGNRKTCPFCKEKIHKDATVCSRCQREIAVENVQTAAADTSVRVKPLSNVD